MSAATADVAVVGSGVCGLLVARELVRAGRDVTVIERGGWKSHDEQWRDGQHELEVPTAAHNDEPHAESPPYRFDYVYAVGGCSLHWAGVAPRFLPADFQIYSRYGVGRDWPITYEQLAPFYEDAEHALSVAGPERSPAPRRHRYPQPPHPYSPVDRLIGPLLEPYFPLPQARATIPVNGRPPCRASARCVLCPVDARYSALHTLVDEGLHGSEGFSLRDRTIAVRLRTAGRQVEAIECVSGTGDPLTLRPKVVVLAANGIENAAILLRSQFEDPDIGKWLFDHEHRMLELALDRPAGHGHGSSLGTGISYAYADGEWRSRSASMLLLPSNPGLGVAGALTRELVSRRRGAVVRRRVRAGYDRTLLLDTLAEDLPRAERRVELSPNRDRFGLPMNRIHFPPDSAYVASARSRVDLDLEQRLASLGAHIVGASPTGMGGHQLGTCHMGERDGVVDPNQRHHRFENLYVAGGSAFPSYGAHHPTLTIAALALRLGRHIATA